MHHSSGQRLIVSAADGRDLSTLKAKRGSGRRFPATFFVVVVTVALALFQFFWILSSLPSESSAQGPEGKRLLPPSHRLLGNATKLRPPLDAFVSTGGAQSVIPRVFIGIKTGEGPTGLRFTQVRKTWLRDALEEATRGRVEVKFFTKSVKFGELPSDPDRDISHLRSMFVPTNCVMKKDLLCATSAMFSYYLDKHGNGTYFCSFDDDQYVIVSNLLLALDDYDRDRGQNLYLGRQAVKGGAVVPQIRGKVHWLTGGAGYCLSRDVVERGRHLFTDLGAAWRAAGRTVGYSDDCAVGYVAVRMLGATLVQDLRFHSHYESKLRATMAREDIVRQISFGYNTKNKNHKVEKFRRIVNETMPNVPALYSSEEDPMLFRSLRCFLIMKETGQKPPECS